MTEAEIIQGRTSDIVITTSTQATPATVETDTAPTTTGTDPDTAPTEGGVLSLGMWDRVEAASRPKPKPKPKPVSAEDVKTGLLPFVELQDKLKGATPLLGYRMPWNVATAAPSLWDTLLELYERNFKRSHPKAKFAPIFTELDFYALIEGFAELIATQSNAAGRMDLYDGIATRKLTWDNLEEYGCWIKATKSELCRSCFGDDNVTTANMRSLDALIRALQDTQLPIPIYTNEHMETPTRLFCVDMGTDPDERKKGKPVHTIYIHPIFRMFIESGYVVKPRGFINDYSRHVKRDAPWKKRLAMLLLRQWTASSHRTGRPVTYPRYIHKLVEDIGLLDAWQKHRKRVEDMLLVAIKEFETMDRPILMPDTKIIYKRGFLDHFYFKINPDATNDYEPTTETPQLAG